MWCSALLVPIYTIRVETIGLTSGLFLAPRPWIHPCHIIKKNSSAAGCHTVPPTKATEPDDKPTVTDMKQLNHRSTTSASWTQLNLTESVLVWGAGSKGHMQPPGVEKEFFPFPTLYLMLWLWSVATSWWFRSVAGVCVVWARISRVLLTGLYFFLWLHLFVASKKLKGQIEKIQS